MELQPDIVLGNDPPPDALDAVVDRIVRLIQEARRVVIVAVNGARNEVGKSYVSSFLDVRLKERSVRVVQAGTTQGWELHERQLHDEMQEPGIVGGVLLLHAYGWDVSAPDASFVQRRRAMKDREIAAASQGAYDRVDFWVGVYRADRPFSYPCVLADVLIRNDGAHNRA